MSSESTSDGGRSYDHSRREKRRRRAALATDARRKLEDADRGRAWFNGREVGGADARYAHLGRSHD